MSPMKFLAKGTAFGGTGIVDKTTAFLFEDKIYEQVGSSLKQFPLKVPRLVHCKGRHAWEN